MLCAGTVGSFLGKSSMSNSRVDQHLHEESNVNGDHMDDLSGAEDDDGSGALGSGGSKKRRLDIMRARWKTKQLEKDYDLLKSQFYALKAENISLQSRNKGLHAQILALKNREPTDSIHLNKEIEESSSNRRGVCLVLS
ncbi:hypothetical protein ACET3Z_015006 [Daucus carota]